jgi:hypothetical protein
MFISKKLNIQIPKFIKINNQRVQVVASFKLLGVTIDNKLNFAQHVANMKIQITIKLYSIKRLFFLNKRIKIQFFKTFILPYFDYCSTLYLYFSKASIQKLFNLYNFCLFKLLKVQFNIIQSADYNKLNNYLEIDRLQSFQHRVLFRFCTFAFKLLNHRNFPQEMQSKFELTRDKEKGYTLRNSNKIALPHNENLNNHENKTYLYFFTKFTNALCIKELDLKFSHYSQNKKTNINILFNDFVNLFPNFDLKYKVPYQ